MNNSIFCCTPVAKSLLVLLRLAIGWHLLYEGLYKLNSYDTPRPWSASGYLERSEGPLANLFQGLVRETDLQTEFDREAIVQRWMSRLNAYDRHYGFNADQRETTVGEVNVSVKRLDEEIFDNSQMQRVLEQYKNDLAASPGLLTSSEQQRMTSNGWIVRNKVRELTAQLETQLFGLMVEPEQKAMTRIATGMGRVAMINRIVMWGLIFSGGGLLLGLFSRFAAVSGAVMLLMFYLAMPAFPGLTAATSGTSHYLYVNNNIIEALALLILAATHSGRWAGLDVFFSKLITDPLYRAMCSRRVTM